MARPRLQQPLFQPGGQIGGHAFHGQGADGFHPRLFGGFEHGGAFRRGGAEAAVHFLVVIGLAQGIGVAGAAHQRHFLRRQIAVRRGQAGLQALQRRRLGGEIDFQLRLARQRTHRDGDGALERFGGRFQVWPRRLPLFNWIPAYAGMLVAYATSTFAALSGNSSPKARW